METENDAMRYWSMRNLLERATPCPICDTHPIRSIEEVLNEKLVFLRCPNNHPYVACGKDDLQAVEHWNIYIAFRINADTTLMFKTMSATNPRSFCRSCQKPTASLVRFETKGADGSVLAVSVMVQQCAICHLDKSRKEAA